MKREMEKETTEAGHVLYKQDSHLSAHLSLIQRCTCGFVFQGQSVDHPARTSLQLLPVRDTLHVC